MSRREAKFSKNKTVAYGWVGRWKDINGKGESAPGWVLPDHLAGGGGNYPNFPTRPYIRGDDKEYLEYCKITIEVVRRNGKPIRKRVRSHEEVAYDKAEKTKGELEP